MRIGGEKPRFFSSKGYIYTLEALVIITLILISISVMFSVPSQRPELEISNIKQQGFESLEYMDKYGDLRRIVSSSNEAELKSLLSPLLSKNLAYEVNICKSNCSSASVAGNETVVAVKYYIADYRNVYTGKKVILWMWRKI
ncbi:MAG: hypothetical protein HYW26_00465 [Candidatus Aenigmarchaeota archaeon]|nr:hypothetical protein [Candidatus Aenigmarchaeota archaeon]